MSLLKTKTRAMAGLHYHYKSDYPNQVHQLNLSISQNYYLLKNDEIKYQIKKLDVNWKNYQETGKRHLVNILIRDHYSNCFYAEIYPIDEVPDIKEFLFNAWKEKKDFEFCGIPKNLIIGRHLVEKFPHITNLSKNLGLNIELARNGFSAGIRSVRDWENNIRYFSCFAECNKIKNFQHNTENICRKINMRNSGKTEPNLLKWVNNEPKGTVINSEIDFYSLFKDK
jgi:hypothetical protein